MNPARMVDILYVMSGLFVAWAILFCVVFAIVLFRELISWLRGKVNLCGRLPAPRLVVAAAFFLASAGCVQHDRIITCTKSGVTKVYRYHGAVTAWDACATVCRPDKCDKPRITVASGLFYTDFLITDQDRCTIEIEKKP